MPRPACLYVALLVTSVTLLLLGSCFAGDDVEGGSEQRLVRPLVVEFDQDVVVRSSVLKFRLRGTNRLVVEDAVLRIKGSTDSGSSIDERFIVLPKREGDVGDLYLELRVRDTIWPLVSPQPQAGFHGVFEVQLVDSLGPVAEGRVDGVGLSFESNYQVQVDGLSGGAVHVNEHIDITGHGFLRPEEGTTWAHIETGGITYGDGRQRSIAGEKVAIVWTGSRTRASFPIAPGVFGVEEASFQAKLRFENELSSNERFAGNTVDNFAGSILQSYLGFLDPAEGSRGQKIHIVGRGFVSTSSSDSDDYGMLLRYEGTFTPADSTLPTLNLTGANALERVPDRVVGEASIEQNVWYGIQGRTLTGFGATPGVFSGTITPLLFDRHGEQEGLAWEGEFRVLPTKQVVYLKYLPAFSKALEKYGLENVERQIRDRILEVVHRDYADVNLVFMEEPPANFIEYATIELGGPDPSGNQAFGYDNTINDTIKDTGNLYLSDYLGGVNVQSGEEFNNPYGGIFIESFSFFSPTLNPDNENASSEFDRIMRPFMPVLGGRAVLASEWPEGARSAAISEAIRMVGNVVGNTVSHEIGHSLGLTFYPDDWISPGHTFHNIIPDNCIMDAGHDRPFEQRAELAGHEPARFNTRNRNYLREILPLPE